MSNEKVNPARDRWEKFRIVAGIVSQLLIPIVVVILPWFWSIYQSNLQQKQKEANMELKALEIFYKDISSGDSIQQNLAVSILKMVNPDFALKMTAVLGKLNSERKLELAKSIVGDDGQSETVRAEAKRIITDLAKDESQPVFIRNEALSVIDTSFKSVQNQKSIER